MCIYMCVCMCVCICAFGRVCVRVYFCVFFVHACMFVFLMFVFIGVLFVCFVRVPICLFSSFCELCVRMRVGVSERVCVSNFKQDSSD